MKMLVENKYIVMFATNKFHPKYVACQLVAKKNYVWLGAIAISLAKTETIGGLYV